MDIEPGYLVKVKDNIEVFEPSAHMVGCIAEVADIIYGSIVLLDPKDPTRRTWWTPEAIESVVYKT